MIALFQKYIDQIYAGHHYKANEHIECFDAWIALGNADTTARDTAIKYLWRLFKKGNEKDFEKDLIKTLHYCIFMLYLLKKGD